MIEPLRYNKETALAYEIHRPAFCNSCLSQKQTRSNPSIAIKFCSECPAALGHQKDFGAFFCKACDDSIHDKAAMRSHLRQLLVVGPSVRKKVLVRGDAVNFPRPLDQVRIKVMSRVYHGGKRIHTEPYKPMTFVAGTSGKCLHVQVLGARNLVAGDVGGLSDPFVVYSFCGHTLGSTRVRPRSLNPRWDNETFVVPMDDGVSQRSDLVASQRDLFRLEVYDRDWLSQHEFLGHIEISKSKLMKMAVVADQQPIRLPLSTLEFHGVASIRVGFTRTHFYVRVLRAESLDKTDALLLSNPYAKVSLGFDPLLLGATPTAYGTINPDWGDGAAGAGNEFSVCIEHLLLRERHIRSNIAINREGAALEHSGGGDLVFNEEAEHLQLLRLEIFSRSRFGKHQLLGKCGISVDDLRHMLPALPQGSAYDLDQFAEVLRRTRRLSGKLSHSVSTWRSDLLGWFARDDYRPEESDGDQPVDVAASAGDADEEAVPAPGPSAAPSRSPTSPVLSRGSMSVRKLLPRFMSRVVFAESVTWSNVYPANVMRDSAKVALLRSAAAMGAQRGSIILRLIPSNRGTAVAGLDDAVRQMTLGEKARVKCRFDLAYNNYCMGSNIPPRANIVFTVKLLEINGRGRFGLPWRLLKRLLRVLLRLLNWVLALIFPKSHPAPSKRKEHRSQKTQGLSQKVQAMLGLSSRGAVAEADISESSASDEDSSDGFEGHAADEQQEGARHDDGGPEDGALQSPAKRLKVDPRMRKHMNPSVRAGAQLLWGFKPPPRPELPPGSAKRQKSSAGLMRDVSARQLEDAVADSDGEGGEGMDGGDSDQSGSEADEEGED